MVGGKRSYLLLKRVQTLPHQLRVWPQRQGSSTTLIRPDGPREAPPTRRSEGSRSLVTHGRNATFSREAPPRLCRVTRRETCGEVLAFRDDGLGGHRAGGGSRLAHPHGPRVAGGVERRVGLAVRCGVVRSSSAEPRAGEALGRRASLAIEIQKEASRKALCGRDSGLCAASPRADPRGAR